MTVHISCGFGGSQERRRGGEQAGAGKGGVDELTTGELAHGCVLNKLVSIFYTSIT